MMGYPTTETVGIVGIDPGLDGAIAILPPAGRSYIVMVMPIIKAVKGRRLYDVVTMSAMAAKLKETHVFLEKLQPMPGKFGGAIANYARGRGMALWEGLLTAHGVRYELVPPVTWQKKMHEGTSGTDSKQRSIVAAQRLFGADLRRTERARTPDHNLAEALLIAEWGRRKMGGA